jgi:hypothetical protein
LLSKLGIFSCLILAVLLVNRGSAVAQSYSIFGNTVPKTPVDPDGNAVTLGINFTSTQAGRITGIRYYRGQGNSHGYTVSLYDGYGKQLAVASIAQDTCAVPCWEQVSFPAPIAINANTRYTAAYYTSNGHYADDQGGLLSNVANAPLTALANGGVYYYGAGIGFPTQTWNSSNYYVDILFTPNTPPQQVISSIALSNKTITANQPAGTVVGQASVTMSPTTPAFSGTLATPSTDAYFQMSGSALVTKAPLGAGTYNTSILATQSGISDSPFTQGETITVNPKPTLSLSLNPVNPSISASAQRGAFVATITASWSDGSPFTGTLGFASPYYDDSATFAISGNSLIINPAGPGVSADAGTTQNVTIVATQ